MLDGRRLERRSETERRKESKEEKPTARGDIIMDWLSAKRNQMQCISVTSHIHPLLLLLLLLVPIVVDFI